MSRSNGLLPHPLLSLLLLACWLWLNNTLAPGHLLLGAALGVGIPYVTRRFWSEPLQVRHPLRVIEYVAVVGWDVVVANLQVAVIIVGPLSRLRPAIVRVPLDLRTDFAAVALASTVTLTPGTVSVEIEDDGAGRRVLLVHALRCLDADALVRTIKQRYERRLQEILEC
ncbi:MAG: Na+/H+ antiporter subunit E [Steroidobacteraceae bacterium]|nr:Na+/H+ antiporter subunit E [Steroidobacteraceae bacterium]